MKKEYIVRWELKTQKDVEADEVHIGGDFYQFNIDLISKRLIDKARRRGAKGFIFTIGPSKVSRRQGGFDAELVFVDGVECHALDCDLKQFIAPELFRMDGK